MKIRVAALCLAAALLTACAGIPYDHPREPSYATPLSRDTATYRAAERWFHDPQGRSGFIPLGAGEEALGARLRLMEAAERSIDMQYFLIKPDLSARLIADGLLKAADRGVRVRFLLDDVFTTAPDEALAILETHPNIEVRLFNPVARSGPQWLAFLRDFPRTNRRMHNKSFTVDNTWTIVGGRNVADEYYAIEQEIEFADFDIAGAGPVAQDVSATFDRFWNSNLAIPVSNFLTEEQLAQAKGRSITSLTDPETLARARVAYDNAVDSPIFQELRSGRRRPVPGHVGVVSDRPEKLHNPVRTGYDDLYQEIVRQIRAAASEIIIVTPYFVPGRERVDLLKEARARGVRVAVVTNSLASTNHPYVHGGYFPWRAELLAAGVELYEAKADSAVSRVTGEPVLLTLHSKGVIIDRRMVFIGSLNMDPRSIDLNTEMGLFIESAELGQYLAGRIERNFPPYVFTLGLSDDGQVRWHYGGGVWHSDPGATPMARIIATLAAILPVEGQL